MIKQSRYAKPLIWAVGTALASVAILELTRTFIRPAYGKGYGLIPDLLGVLPNFLAGFGIPFLALGVYYFCMLEMEHTAPEHSPAAVYTYKQLALTLRIVAALNTTGLLLWEVFQIDSKLVYDIKDMAATVAGSVVCLLLFAKAPAFKI